MKKQRITINDIARACGVSRATVSLVLRNSPRTAKKTRELVLKEIERQGYVYNRLAANLRQQSSSIVGLVINDLSNPYFAEFTMGVDEALGEKGYVTLLCSTGESLDRQHRVLASLVEHNPAGIILSPAEHSVGADVHASVGGGVPVLVFNRDLPDVPWDTWQWDYVALDNRRGAELATRHLLQLGHTRIGFFGGHPESSSCRERRAGYADALKAAGIRLRKSWVVDCASTRAAATENAHGLFRGSSHPTAAVCYNDAVALGLMAGVVARGQHPGKDFAITGFDDIYEASSSSPRLTTIATDPRERGREAGRRLLARVAAPSTPAERMLVPVQLVVRNSTCPPPATAKS